MLGRECARGLIELAVLLAVALGSAASQAARAEDFQSGARLPPCARQADPSKSESVQFTGLYPAIEGKLHLSNFKAGQIVEIDPRTMSVEEAGSYVKSLQALGALVSIYLVGGHCDLGEDCDSLKGVQLGPTGSWKWNESERRILDITHPAVLTRLANGIRNGWRLGANFIRIDNLHNPAGSTHPRTPAQLKMIADLGHDIEDRLRAEGTIASERVTGLVAHNSLATWRRLIEDGALRRLPSFLTSERTAQLAAFPGYEGDARQKAGRLVPSDVPDIEAGRRIAEFFQIPYSIVEFRQAHDLAHPGGYYLPPRSYVEALKNLSGVTEVLIIEDESSYVGRPEVLDGPGPRRLPRKFRCCRSRIGLDEMRA